MDREWNLVKDLFRELRRFMQNDPVRKGFGRTDLLEVGENSYGTDSITIHAWNNNEKVVIGKYCSIGEGLTIILGGGHDLTRISTYPFAVGTDSGAIIGDSPGHPVDTTGVFIGSDVWIGMGVTIMGGVRVGNGSVIGAKSMVTRNIGDYEIHAGHPAIKVGDRFEPKTKQKLIELSWWEKDLDWIMQNKELLISQPSAEILDYLQNS